MNTLKGARIVIVRLAIFGHLALKPGISAITTNNFQRLNLIVVIATMSSLGDYDDKFWENKCNRCSAKTSHPPLRNNFLQCNSFLLF